MKILLVTCLSVCACATTGSQAAPVAEDAGPRSGMVLSHTDAEAPHCFSSFESNTVCPVTGAALPFDNGEAAASLASQQHNPATCDGGLRDTQCVVPTGSRVAEDQ